jgi:hypothetical protein
MLHGYVSQAAGADMLRHYGQKELAVQYDAMAAETLRQEFDKCYLGAQMNVMDYQTTYVEDMTTASSTAYGNIMDYDLATETTALAAAQLKQNGAMAMLAQANASQDMVSYLLKQYIN